MTLGVMAVSVVSARGMAATVSAARRVRDAPPAGLFPFFNNWKEAMFIPKLIAAVGVLVAVAAGVWPSGHAGAEPPAAKAEVPKAKPAEPKWVGTWVRHDEIRDDLGILWDTRTCIAIGETAFTYTVDWVHKRGKLQYRFDGEYSTGTDGRVFGFLAKAGSSPDQVENSKYDRFLKQLVGVPFTLAAAVEGKTLTLDSPRGLPSFGDHKIDPANTRSLLVGKYTRVDPKKPLPPLKPAEPPTDAEVLRALPKPKAVDVLRDDVTITKTRVGLRGEDGKVSWECAVYFTEVIETPDGAARKPRVQVVTIWQ